MAEIAFREAPFKTAGGTTARSLDEWFSDVINVKEMGATGDGDTDDSGAIQAAFDLAFGPSSAPHGEDNKHLNRPVFFPQGRYMVASTLLLTRVVGGEIYGSGEGPTSITWDGVVNPDGSAIVPVLHINGAVGLHMHSMAIGLQPGQGPFTGEKSCAILLDWDGVSGEATAGNTGGGGLRFNHFSSMSISAGEYGVIIADSGYEGHNNLFLGTIVGGDHATSLGIDVRGPDAVNNSMVGGGVTNCGQGGVRCPVGGGSLHSQGVGPTGNGPVPYVEGEGADFIMESGHIMHISQLRTESLGFLRQENGIVLVQCYQSNGSGIEVNGGKCIIECSQLCSGNLSTAITGTGGQVYISGSFDGETDNLFAGYSGTIAYDPDNMEDL